PRDRRAPRRTVRAPPTAGGELRDRRTAGQGRGARLPLGPAGQGAGRMATLPRRRRPRPPERSRFDRNTRGEPVTIPPHVPGDPWYTGERLALRETATRFAEREILPHQDRWEADGLLPRELHRKAGDLGLLGVSFPEEVGGGGGDIRDSLIVCEARHEAGASGGGFASLVPRGRRRMAGGPGPRGPSRPEAVGGGGGDIRDSLIVCEALHEAGVSGGVFASLFTCGIATPHLAASGRPDQIEQWVRPTLAGDMI